jgi:hypothetical protein
MAGKKKIPAFLMNGKGMKKGKNNAKAEMNEEGEKPTFMNKDKKKAKTMKKEKGVTGMVEKDEAMPKKEASMRKMSDRKKRNRGRH